MKEVVMALAMYVFMALSSLSQLALGIYVWHSQREKIKAEATQTTANAFDKIVGTLTKVSTDLGDALLKSIDSVNLREEKINKLDDEIKALRSDNKELRDQLGDAISGNAQRDNMAELQQKSIGDLVDANSNQATELIEVKAQLYTLQKEIKTKNEELQKRDVVIKEKDEKIERLEGRIRHLEEDVERLKNPVPPPEEKVVEVKAVETKTEGVNPS